MNPLACYLSSFHLIIKLSDFPNWIGCFRIAKHRGGQDFRMEPEQARAAEVERCQGKSRKQLEERMVELTRMLASARLHSKARLEQAWLAQAVQSQCKILQVA